MFYRRVRIYEIWQTIEDEGRENRPQAEVRRMRRQRPHANEQGLPEICAGRVRRFAQRGHDRER